MDAKFEIEVPTGDIVMVLPVHFLRDGDAMEKMPDAVEAMIRCIAEHMSFWPVDFGETQDNHTVLWFARGVTKQLAIRQAENFIKKNGYV